MGLYLNLSSFQIRNLLLGSALVLALFAPKFASAYNCDFYIAPNGSTSGNGSLNQPWSFAHAASGAAGNIKAGQTVCLKGGTYVTSAVTITVSGSVSSPVIFRNAPGERPIIDAAGSSGANTVTIGANNFWIWGIEFTDSSTTPAFKTGLTVSANTISSSNIKVINCIAHDMGGAGLSAWKENKGAELFGNYSFYNGRNVSARGYGIYTQNGLTTDTDVTKIATKLYEDNYFFWNFGHYNVHAYGQDVRLDNMTWRGNVSVDGIMMVGGTTYPARNLVWESNFNFNTSGSVFNSIVYIGYSAGVSNAIIKDNYFTSGRIYWAYANSINQFSGNSTRGEIFYHNNTPSGINTAQAQTDIPAAFPNNNYIIAAWPAEPPKYTGVRTFVRPNRYESGRGNIVVYNFDGANSTSVDLSTLGLEVGQQFEIRDGQNFFGLPVYQAAYTGAKIDLPLVNSSVTSPRTIPAGSESEITEITHTSKEFNFFTVLPGAVTAGVPKPNSPINLHFIQ